MAMPGLEPEALLSWSFEPLVVVPAVAAATLYLRGWATLSRRMPARFGVGRAVIFLGGLAGVVLALCSPLDALSQQFLQAHMVQHLLLMLVTPPLLWLGAPVAPLLLGLPHRPRQAVAAGLATRPARGLTRALGNPRITCVAFILAFWFWHVPALYDLALRSDTWHHVEHFCFFAAALAFWWPVIRPWPARSVWPRWPMIGYLLVAEAQNTLLSAILTFSDRVIYPFYDAPPRAGGLTALEDQSLAGVIMWIPGSLAFAVPVLWIVLTSLAAPPRAPMMVSGRQAHGDERPAASASS
jgi:cytochrome c oxidase assembly factor CtaG